MTGYYLPIFSTQKTLLLLAVAAWGLGIKKANKAVLIVQETQRIKKSCGLNQSFKQMPFLYNWIRMVKSYSLPVLHEQFHGLF